MGSLTLGRPKRQSCDNPVPALTLPTVPIQTARMDHEANRAIAGDIVMTFGGSPEELRLLFAQTSLKDIVHHVSGSALSTWTRSLLEKVLQHGRTAELVEILGQAFPSRHDDISRLAKVLLVRVEDHPAYAELTAKAKVVLMVSVDLESSKQLKHGSVAVYQDPWTVKFQRFYDQFPLDLRTAYEGLRPAHASPVRGNWLDLLRVDDDDLMFSVPLRLHQEVVPHVQAVIDALERFNDRRWTGLKCKATAWLCGVPVTDLEVLVPGHAPSWVGPSMDMGYSLTRWSKPSRMTIALDVAAMICDAVTKPNPIDYGFELRFGGREIPAGQVFLARYPRVWVAPPPNGDIRPADIEAISEKPVSPTELAAYLEQYRSEQGLVRWFLKDDPDERYAGPTQTWLDRFQTILAKEREAEVDYPDDSDQ